MLEVKNLSIKYGDHAVLQDLNLSLQKDEILMLVGPTGCGKTTFLHALAGLVPITKGEVSFNGWRSSVKEQVAPEKRNMGMVFQDFALFPHLTVEENIGFRLRDSTQVDLWLQQLRLEPWRHAKPDSLSGGQKQRVALARALAHKPACILLDEPLSNLDAALKDEVRWEIRNALKSAGVPAVWVTHDQDEALSVGDRIGVLENGRLAQLGTPSECYSEPISPFVARFLGEASFLNGVLEHDNSEVTTALGVAPAFHLSDSPKEVSLLLRPDDISLSADEAGNGTVRWARYEGSSRLYAVEINDGSLLKVRTSHENQADPGDKVMLAITTTHALAVFDRSSLR